MFTIRQARSTDWFRILSLVLSAHLNPTGLDWRRFVVAVDSGDQVIGCCQIKPHRDGSQELASLVVDTGYRDLGIGSALVEHLIEIQGGNLYLMCRDSLGGYYNRFGFQALSNPAKIPPYFRRIAKLVSLLDVFRREGQTLLVMKY